MQETRNHIKNNITLALSLDKGSLIDFETTGLPNDEEGDHEIITLGYFHRNNVVITQRKCADKLPFYVEITKIIDKLPRPFYSYNTSFERTIMRLELDMNVPQSDFVDIMKPWKDKAARKAMKWPSLDELISEPEDYFRELKVSGESVPKMWRIYRKSNFKFEQPVLRIMDHCFSDILRESILLLRYQPRQIITAG